MGYHSRLNKRNRRSGDADRPTFKEWIRIYLGLVAFIVFATALTSIASLSKLIG